MFMVRLNYARINLIANFQRFTKKHLDVWRRIFTSVVLKYSDLSCSANNLQYFLVLYLFLQKEKQSFAELEPVD